MKYALALVPVLAVLAACNQHTSQQRSTATLESMVDQRTEVLNPKYIDRSFSLVNLYEERMGEPIANSDSRLIDAKLDAAMREPPSAAGQIWTNAVTHHSGKVDLLRWDIDQRGSQVCGAFEHSARLPRDLGGAVILCRSRTDRAWRLDEVVWNKPKPSSVQKSPMRVTENRLPSTTSRPSNQPSVQSPPSRAGQRPAGHHPPPCPENVGAGAQTLGDCLSAPN